MKGVHAANKTCFSKYVYRVKIKKIMGLSRMGYPNSMN